MVLVQTKDLHSIAAYGLSPIYENEFILATVLPYKTESGSLLGTVVGITEKKNLQKLFQPLNGLSPLATTYLALLDQKLVYSDPETGEFRLVESNSQNKFNSIFPELMTQESPQPRTLDITTSNGEDALVQLQWSPKIQTGVVFETRAGDIYGQIESLIPFTVLLILGTLLAIGLVMVVGINRVIKPLRSLSDITRGYADGDWSRRAEVLSNDEVGILASSFNQMADELGKVYRSLEQKVNEGERQIRTTADVAQNITTFSNLDETFNKTVELLVQQFGFYQASIFLIERSGKNIEFKTGFGPATENLVKKKYGLEVDSESIIGWVSANNQARIASNVMEEPLHLRNELLPETRSEASVPISIGNLVLGVLDVQSTEVDAFSPETVIMLQTLASQIATAIQAVGLAETSQVNFEELARLYRSSRLIAEANTEQEVLEISSQILKEAPYPIILFQIKNKKLAIFLFTDATRESTTPNINLPKFREANMEEIENYLLGGEVFAALNSDDIPGAFEDIMRELGLDSTAYLPIRKNGTLAAILMVGGRSQNLSNATMQPYINLTDLMSITMEKADAIQQTKKHLHNVEALASLTEAISTASNQQVFFRTLQTKLRQIIGNYNMSVALYDEKSNTISIPFNYENEKISTIRILSVRRRLNIHFNSYLSTIDACGRY